MNDVTKSKEMDMLPNEYGMTPTVIAPIKDIYYKIYNPDELMKHASIIEAKEILKKMGMSDFEFERFLHGIWFWPNAIKLQQTKADYENKMKMSSLHIKEAINLLRECGGPDSRVSLREVIMYANERVDCIESGLGGDEKIEFYTFDEREKSLDIDIIKTLTAISIYCNDTKSSSYELLDRLREIKPGDTKIVKDGDIKKTVKKKNSGQVKFNTNRAIVTWIYLNLVKIEEKSEKFRLKYRNKHAAISKIATVIAGRSISQGLSCKTLPEVSKSHAPGGA